ncbi:MAG TPA: PilZ domain-containing protein [Terriglobales bacterium]|nr:PilZ domain-containing protein [Terriglobales bacterium]
MVTATATPPHKRVTARAALVHLEDNVSSILQDCLRQFKIEATLLSQNASGRMQHEKFDACIITLNDEAAPVLESIRSSRSNARMILFGVCKTAGDAVRFSRFGINVLLESPIERQTALRAVRATHLLILNEFRRYVRIPVVANAELFNGSDHIVGSTVEISGGGMSFRFRGKLKIGDEVQIVLELPGRAATKIRGIVSWLHPKESIAGVRFDASDDRRMIVKSWIEQYLEIN